MLFILSVVRSYAMEHSRHRGGYPDRSESMDWQKAAEAWARSKSRDGTGILYPN